MKKNFTLIIFMLILNLFSCNDGVEKQFKNYLEKHKKETVLVSYGDHWVGSVISPHSWKYDQNGAEKGKFSIYLLPNDANVSNVFIYGIGFNNTSKTMRHKKVVPRDLILRDIELFQKESPGVIITKKPTMLKFGRVKRVYEYNLKNYFGTYRKLTYFELHHTFIVIGYSALNEKLYNTYLDDYLRLVKTFRYWGNNPDELLEGHPAYQPCLQP